MRCGFEKLFLLVLIAGPAGAAFLSFANRTHIASPMIHISWDRLLTILLIAPIIEELAFRGGLQSFLQDVFSQHATLRLPFITLANALTSVVFCLCHLLSQSVWMASLILLPSLLLGYLWERTNSMWPCIGAHCWFNLCFVLAIIV